MTDTSTQAVEAILTLGEGITPGPWDLDDQRGYDGRITIRASGSVHMVVGNMGLTSDCKPEANRQKKFAEVNATAIAAVPAMLDMIRALASERDELLEDQKGRIVLHTKVVDEVIRLEAKLASARRTALEDAAKVADHHINGAAVAKNIRALIEEEQK